MLRLTVVAFAALCLMGTSSLALAGPMDAVEDTSAKGEMKGKKSAGDPMSAVEDTSAKGEMKGKKKEHKEKKAHKGSAPAAPAAPASPAAP